MAVLMVSLRVELTAAKKADMMVVEMVVMKVEMKVDKMAV